MTQKEWNTQISRSLADGLNFTFRGFEGEYEVLVRNNGNLVQTETFVVDECTSYTLDVTDSLGKLDTQQKHLLVHLLIFTHNKVNWVFFQIHKPSR